MRDDQIARGKAGNLYDKYGTKNPVAAFLMSRFLRAFDQLSAMVPRGKALEAGCGEGELIRRLARRGWETAGFDADEAVIAEARRRDGLAAATSRYFVGDLQAGEFGDETADLVVCCEVLEHLERPEVALRILSKVAPFALVSVPREPIWRMLNLLRGAYVANWGNTDGHLQHWSTTGFLEFLGGEFEPMAVRNPLPWTMVLCRSRQFKA